MTRDVFQGKKKIGPIAERRPSPEVREKMAEKKAFPEVNKSELTYPVWRCKVCGYVCARDEPPDLCPICKASKERFERFM